ncbi:MAG: NAD(P)/FAD-dependent oxidoreductase [Saprospiraceae bacterium]|nr:NAD(P)/FAD-dependent oxidoreductase [Saprospiraceae bacterium]
MKIICIGGGAASFFFAANAAKNHDITIVEQGKEVLQKVRISGGGRCNVTHDCHDPMELVQHYPRGRKELLGPFYHFGPAQMIEWLNERGVPLKIEADGRMFPITNSSQTIIDCLKNACEAHGVQVKTGHKVKKILPLNKGEKGYDIEFLNHATEHFDAVFIGTGSSKAAWQMLEHLGHTVVPGVPSLFTFSIKDARIKDLPGVAVNDVEVHIPGQKKHTTGPLLITHKGLSGPAILKLSAQLAPFFHSCNYTTQVVVDFLPALSEAEIRDFRNHEGKRLLNNYQLFGLPKRLFFSLLRASQLDGQKKWATLSNGEIDRLVHQLKHCTFQIQGQNRFKEEFVTAGGIDLKEIDFINFSSKRFANMYLAGEVLNIDAVTGGFNFQAAWTGAYLAAQSVCA